jgi:hypothetical protein
MAGRIAACAGVFVVSALLVAHRTDPATAQGQKDNTTDKQLKSLQQDLLQQARLNANLKQQLVQLQAANEKLEAALKKDKKGDDKAMKSLQSTLDGYRGAGLIHVVVLKAKPETKPADVQAMIDDANAQLSKIRGVRGLWAGKPASGSPGDYTAALVLVFDDALAVKSYLDDPVHDQFAAKHLKNYEKPIVYDFAPRKARP